MSDLQCPATVLLVPNETVASNGRGLAVGGRRLAGVFVAPAIAADPRGLAAVAGLVGDEAACPIETMADVVDGTTLAATVEHLADLYRGETIAVVTTRRMIRDVLGHASALEGPITVAIDGSGWVVIAGS